MNHGNLRISSSSMNLQMMMNERKASILVKSFVSFSSQLQSFFCFCTSQRLIKRFMWLRRKYFIKYYLIFWNRIYCLTVEIHWKKSRRRHLILKWSFDEIIGWYGKLCRNKCQFQKKSRTILNFVSWSKFSSSFFLAFFTRFYLYIQR